MKTIILHWTPKSWAKFGLIPYMIEDGICEGGMNQYHPWKLSSNIEINEGDLFYIVFPEINQPNTPVYDYLRNMGMTMYPISGVYICGVIRGIDETLGDDDEDDLFDIDDEDNLFDIDDEDENEDKTGLELDLGIQFAALPGLIENLDLPSLKNEIPSVNWDKHGETILNNEEAKIFNSLFVKWIKSNKFILEYSPYTNIINRSIDKVLKVMSLDVE